MSKEVGTDPAKMFMQLAEVNWRGVDFGRGIHQVTAEPLRLGSLLPDGAKLTGTPTISVSPATGLAYASEQINPTQFNDPSSGYKAIVPLEGVIAKFTPSIKGTYSVTISCADTLGNTQSVEAIIVVK